MMHHSTADDTVTVAVNTYNGASYIRAAIDSILAQSFQDFELLILDDASTDDTVDIIKSYDDKRIRLLESEKAKSVAEARSNIVKAAKCTWIAFLDQDDLWTQDKLARQIKTAKYHSDLSMIYGRALRFGNNKRHQPYDTWFGSSKLPEGRIFRDVLSKPSFVPMSTIFVRRDIALRMLPMPDYVRHCPDYFIALQAARLGTVAALQDVCCFYRVHSESMSQTLEAEIHAEAAAIIEAAAGTENQSILTHRRIVSASMIARTEIQRGDVRQGLSRLFRDGSIAFLALRKPLHAYRRAKNSAQGRKMKYQTLQAIRQLGFLKLWDRLSFGLKTARTAKRNQAFLNAHPDFKAPPTELSFDAYNSIDLEHYHTCGQRQAEGFAHQIKAYSAKHDRDKGLRVLEWGCGPARLIKHIPNLLKDLDPEVFGTDYNTRSIEWCSEHIDDVTFRTNNLEPPLDFPSDYFDVCYNFSVFTHLSESVQLEWASELKRVLKPGGLLISTTHGKNFDHLIVTEQDQADHAQGKLVVQDGYEEGKKWFFAIHPDAFVTEKLLAAFTNVRKVDGTPWGITQDVWLSEKA